MGPVTYDAFVFPTPDLCHDFITLADGVALLVFDFVRHVVCSVFVSPK
jgi:hypothetical protein